MKLKHYTLGTFLLIALIPVSSTAGTIWGQTRPLEILRNETGRIAEIHFPSGQVARYHYDSAGTLRLKDLIGLQFLPRSTYLGLEPEDELFHEGLRQEFSGWLNRPVNEAGEMLFPTAEEFLIRFFESEKFKTFLREPGGFWSRLGLKEAPPKENPTEEEVYEHARDVYFEMVMKIINARKTIEFGDVITRNRLTRPLNDPNLSRSIRELVPLFMEIVDPAFDPFVQRIEDGSEEIDPDSAKADEIQSWVSSYGACSPRLASRVREQLDGGHYFAVTNARDLTRALGVHPMQPFFIPETFPGLEETLLIFPSAFSWSERTNEVFGKQYNAKDDKKAKRRRQLLIGHPDFSFDDLGPRFDPRMGWLAYFSNRIALMQTTELKEYVQDFRFLTFMTEGASTPEVKYLREKVFGEYFTNLATVMRSTAFYVSLDELVPCL